ncbi:hypothetical protein LTS18_012020, partial [Coniosporium uncinatum]
MRPSSIHKRPVNFSHIRRSSTASQLTPMRDTVSTKRASEAGSWLTVPQSEPNVVTLASTPAVQSEHIVRSRKENLVAPAPRLSVRSAQSPGRYIEREARKVSTELEKACEEAFNRSSIGSSIHTNATDKPSPYSDTPPSSVSHGPSPVINKASTLDSRAIANRPLPPLPTETPKTYTARELAETRHRLAARYAESGEDGRGYYESILQHLDNLLPPQHRDGSRAASAPQSSADHVTYLPAISEESRLADGDEEDLPGPATARRYHRSVTEPFRSRTGKSHTIRMVEPSSPCPPGEKPIAPLNIRKVSGASSSTGSASRPSGNDITAGKTPQGGRFYGRYRPNITIHEDDDADEDNVLEAGKDDSMSKRKNWWSRKDKTVDRKEEKDKKDEENDPAKHKRQWEDLDDRVDRQDRRSPATATKVNGKNGSDQLSQASSEFPMRVDVPEPKTITPKKSFLDMFKKR